MNEIAVATESLMPQTMKGKYEMAGVLARSGLIPKGLDTAEKVFVALQWGHELQLSPMVAVNNVAVINGKPTLSADIMSAVVKRSPEYGGIEWIKNTDTEAECKITRILGNGKTESIISRFTIEDAKKAGLAGRDVWQKYPRRMLKHRCLSYGLKDMFPDILAGLYTPEEMESTMPEQPSERIITDIEPNSGEPIEQDSESVVQVDFENHTATTIIEPTQTDEYEQLKKVIDKYGDILKKSSNSPTPYEQAMTALESGNADEMTNKYLRCIKWLGAQGVAVEV